MRRQLFALESSRCTRQLVAETLGAAMAHDQLQTNRILSAVGGMGWRNLGPISAAVPDRTASESAAFAAILCSLGLAAAGGIQSTSVPITGGASIREKLFAW